jgi:hypothetical protein
LGSGVATFKAKQMRTGKIAHATGAAHCESPITTHQSPITNHDSVQECGLLGCAGGAKLPGGEQAELVRVARKVDKRIVRHKKQNKSRRDAGSTKR